jgi:hypothetical protein
LGVCLVGVLCAPSHAQESTTVGISASALPGYAHVGAPERPAGTFSVAADAGYANWESIGGAGASHHRIVGSLSLGAAATDWLLVWGNLSGYYSRHRQGGATDSSEVGLPSLGLRAYHGTGTFSYGAEAEVKFPGRDAPSVDFKALTPELRALAGFDPNGPLVLGAFVGFRLDRTSKAAPDVLAFSAGDRVALDASQYNAVPFGVAVGARLDPLLVFAELSGDPLLGVPVRVSPLRATLGARQALSARWQAELLASAGLSSRPKDPFGPDVVPFEPRFSTSLGLRYTFGTAAEPASQPTPEQPPKAKPEPKPEQMVKPAPVERSSRVQGVVRDAEGTPLPQVDVKLHAGDQELTTTTDSEGRYAFESVPKGEAELEFETVDYQPARASVTIPGDGKPVDVVATTLKLEALSTQIQGLVQTFEGEPLAATIRITPPGDEHQSGADGRFVLDVAPGRYTVLVSKPGFVTQTHDVVVGDKEVVVINVDLRRKK